MNNFLRASNLPRQSSSAPIDPNQQKFLKSILINNTTMPKGAKYIVTFSSSGNGSRSRLQATKLLETKNWEPKFFLT